MTVLVVTGDPRVDAVHHPSKVYPARVGSDGRVQTAVLYATDVLLGV